MFTAPTGWSDGTGQSIMDPSLPQMESDDAQVFARLIQRYGPFNLMFYLRQIGDSEQHKYAARMSTATMSSNTPSVFSSAQSITSDAASVYTVATQSTWDSAAEPAFHNTEYHEGVPWTPSSHISGESPDAAIAMSASGVRKNIECTLCFMDGVSVGFTRKSDFKKHLQHFHCTNAVWICPYTGCRASFDFEKAFVNHAKSAHSDVHLPSNKARQETCPQLVFACGFKSCKDRVFEAPNEEAAAVLKEKYFDHVAKHFDTGILVGEWQYSVVMHNLLRQNGLKAKWKSCVWNKSHRNQLRWRPDTSGELKRLLECRHLYDNTGAKNSVYGLLHFLFNLGERYAGSGFNTAPMPPIPLNFNRPLRQECPMAANSHANLPAPTAPEPPFEIPAPRPISNMGMGHNQTTPQPHHAQLQQQQQQQQQHMLMPRPPSSHPMQSVHTPVVHVKPEPTEAWPHPGTPLTIPEAGEWPEQPLMFGPGTDSNNNMMYNGIATTSPNMDIVMSNDMQSATEIAPWVNVEPNHNQNLAHHISHPGHMQHPSLSSLSSAGSGSSRPRTPSKRTITRGLEHLRSKRRTGSEGMSMPRMISQLPNQFQAQMMPLRGPHQSVQQIPNTISMPPTSQPNFYQS